MSKHQARFCAFDEIEGYKTRANAIKRGEEVAAKVENSFKQQQAFGIQWTVASLPNGRFAPLFVINQHVPGGPGMFIGMRNVLLMN